MWFQRKPKNRRLGRDYVLDVKLRSSQVRAARVRLAAVGLTSVFAAILGVCLLWRAGEWALDRLVYENKAFAVQEIDVQTDGIIAVDQLRRWTGVKPEQNLLALDLAKVKRDLELVPQVQSVSVERLLPHKLVIRVVEREPIAQITLPRPGPNGVELASFLIDGDGFVIPPLDPHLQGAPVTQPADQLPLIARINPGEIQTGKRIETAQVQSALQLLKAFEQSPMAGLVDLKRIDVSAPDVLLVSTGQGSDLTFGLTDLDQQLRRWRVVYDSAQRAGKIIASLDLAITNNLPARWLEASAAPPAPPKSTKPLHLRKKHV